VGIEISLKEVVGVLSKEQTLLACDGKGKLEKVSVDAVNSNLKIKGVTTDSRQVKKNCLFFARRGEEMNGHTFISDVISDGGEFFVVEKSWADVQLENLDPSLTSILKENNNIYFMVVEDSTLALGKLANYWRNLCGFKTIVITGSCGKTTTKEMLKTILTHTAEKGYASDKSFNNHVGLPQTILEADKDCRWLVLEAGMNHAGEMEYLSSVAEPDIAVLLNVGPAHMGFFKSLTEIASAKAELLHHLKESGEIVFNADDSEVVNAVSRVEATQGKKFKKTLFGLSPVSNYYASHISVKGQEGTSFKLNAGDQAIPTLIPHPGVHNALNAVSAIAVSKVAFPELDLFKVCDSLKFSTNQAMRFQMEKLNDFLLVNDAYNANPSSMRASIMAASKICKNSGLVLILGDMLELGDDSEKFHTEIGKLAGEVKAHSVFAIGEFAQAIVDGAKMSGILNAEVATSIEQCAELVRKINPTEIKVVLVKGSRGMKLERVVDLIRKNHT
jgi:UDP-N-acetylmuramoyl-tripeptide--D-alanyl-D-alanine ligase